MTDLVERLRNHHTPTIYTLDKDAMRSAADEIERLRALCKQQHEALLYTGAYAERGKALAAFKEFNK
jgi:hypothetical protein